MLAPGKFRIVQVPSNGATERYRATAGAGCTFDIVLTGAMSEDSRPVSITLLSLERRPGADCRRFLRELAPELGFVGELPSPPASQRLECSLAVLARGKGQRQENAVARTGPTTVTLEAKLFVADGTGEVFLDWNLNDGLGGFSLKDPDYATVVVTELAKVLLP